MDNLKELMNLCKHSVSVEINNHRNYYESVEESLAGCSNYPQPEVLAEMIKTDTIIQVQAYPDNAIGFYCIYHYDLGTAINMVIKAIKEEKL